MAIRIDPKLHPAQQQIASSAARFRILVAGRRFGKTRLGTAECINAALAGGRAWWVAPTYTQAEEGWRPLKNIAAQIPHAEIHRADREIILPGGGMIQVRTAKDPDKLRGAGLDFVVIDEAALCSEKLWGEILRGAVSDRKGRALFISTPKGKRNWFHALVEKAEGRPDWDTFTFSTLDNPFYDPEEFASIRDEIGSLVFAQEYEAQFVEMAGALFRTEWMEYGLEIEKDGAVWWKNADSGRMVDSREGFRFVTVDLAASTKTTADYTCIAACAMTQGVLVVLEVVRRRMEGPDILPEVRRVMSAHNIPVVHMESAGFQLSLVQQARRDGLAVKELKADRDKIARALPLQARMEGGGVWFLPGPWLKELELELFGFPGSEHDDQVDALAYAAVVAGQTAKPRPGLEGLAGFGVRTSPNRPG